MSWNINLALENSKQLKSFQAFFADHNVIRLDINYRKKKKKTLKIQTYGG